MDDLKQETITYGLLSETFKFTLTSAVSRSKTKRDSKPLRANEWILYLTFWGKKENPLKSHNPARDRK